MPRTKINKATKRSRGTHDEKLQEFDLIADSYLMDLEQLKESAMTNIEDELLKIRSKLPESVLKMKMSDYYKASETFSVNSPAVNPRSVLQSISSFIVNSPAAASTQIVQQPSVSDDGYTTQEETNRASRSSSRHMPIPKITGPLMSAQIRQRRSRSAQSSTGTLYTPQVYQSKGMQQQPQSNRHLLKRTQSNLLSSRPSRPKYRTPVMAGRLKAASVDRLQITPKVQPNTPMALLRHARTGESVFSVSGSPVITSIPADKMANVNIPIGDSVLSIRPTEMGSIDPAYLSRIDQSTIDHLRVLQQNINRIMESAARAHT